MKHLRQLTVFMWLAASSVYADSASTGGSEVWLRWFGNYHYIFVHFPIALIIAACAAELVYAWRENPQYGFVVNFLLISAALLVIPTVFSGMSLEESGAVVEEGNTLLEWHKVFGIATLALTIITVMLRNFQRRRALYLWSLFFLLICVVVTAHLGGLMAFADFNLLPPFFNIPA